MTQSTVLNPDVAKQYAKWVYPQPVENLQTFFSKGGYVFGDPSQEFHRIWPDRARFEPTVLVPGCGTSLAPQLAYKNPNARIVGLDMSETSLAHARHLKSQHRLDNLELINLDLHDVASLGETFDYILVTGVLHHLPDPVAGGKALADVLAPGGAMHVMLYGMGSRVGVYMLQRVFKELELTQSEDDVRLVQDALKQLPDDHSVQKYIKATRELDYPGAIVDTFLHPQDRAYWADEIFDFAEAIGLSFQEWIDPARYHPIAMVPATHPLYDRIARLDRRTQAIVIDRLIQKLGTHRFILRNQPLDGRDWNLDFDGDAAWSWVPHRHPRLKLENKADGSGRIRQHLVRDGLNQQPAPLVKAVLGVMDGKRTLRQCLEALAANGAKLADDSEVAIKRVVRDLYHLGHVLIEKRDA